MSTVLKTQFGEFRGKNGNGVVQYLGIKYAALKDQLSIPEMVDSYGSDVVDATVFGPSCPTKYSYENEQNVLIQCNIGTSFAPPMFALDCLNLNITVPSIKIHQPLPVMVFIHGGGFIMGSNHWPQYNPARLVKLSMEIGMPIIGVNINYRLGVLGNLTSEELRKAGYPGNNSLRDQKCALQWIKAHIADFGGDPENVTAFGVSAGSTSVLHQLFSKEPLFKRAISMSGTSLMLKPLPLPVAETAYGLIMKAFDLETHSVQERVQRLLSVTSDELVAKIPMAAPLVPFLDGEFVTTTTTFAKLSEASANTTSIVPGREWCSELMIGDCQHDGNVYFYMGLAERKADIAAAITTSLTTNLSTPSAAKAVLQAYNITPSTSDDEAMKSIIDLATDIAYYAPALSFAQSFPGKTYYYHFNAPNPWEGTFKGCSVHLLDAVFLFQNFNEKLEPEAKEVAVQLAKNFVRFANGETPWDEFNKEKRNVKTFGPSKDIVAGVAVRNGWGGGRSDRLFRLKEAGKVDLDELSVAWDLFIAGK